MAGASAWNSAGTWEERDFSDWSHKKIKERLNAASWKNGDDHLSLTTDNVTGDAVVLFVKGKKRLGYDLEIKFKWRGQSAGKAITGNGVLKLESDTGGDVEFSLTHEVPHGRSVESELKKLVNEELQAWKNELIQK